MARHMHTYYLDEDLAEGLRAIHYRDGVLPSEQVRRAIRMWLTSKGYTFKPQPRAKKGGKKK